MTAARIEAAGLTLDECAAALLRLAELAILDDFPARALPSCVAPLASPAVHGDLEQRFEALVEAVRERQRFDADPRGYADTHDWPTRETALDALDEKLQGEVDDAIRVLLHPGGAS